MDEKPENTWGPLGILALLIGIASVFLGNNLSLILGFAAVMLGFFGSRRRQKLSVPGMFIGAVVLLFVNLLNLGIVPAGNSLQTDRSHLINSINASISVFNALGENKNEDGRDEKIIGHCREALQEANLVNADEVDKQVPGFDAHYRNEFIRGMKLFVEGYEKADIGKKLEGGFLLDKWALWNKENRQNLGKIGKATPSLFSMVSGLVFG